MFRFVFNIRIAENQMKIKKETALLAASKLQWGQCDVFIISGELAEVYRLNTVNSDIMEQIQIKGGDL